MRNHRAIHFLLNPKCLNSASPVTSVSSPCTAFRQAASVAVSLFADKTYISDAKFALNRPLQVPHELFQCDDLESDTLYGHHRTALSLVRQETSPSGLQRLLQNCLWSLLPSYNYAGQRRSFWGQSGIEGHSDMYCALNATSPAFTASKSAGSGSPVTLTSTPSGRETLSVTMATLTPATA